MLVHFWKEEVLLLELLRPSVVPGGTSPSVSHRWTTRRCRSLLVEKASLFLLMLSLRHIPYGFVRINAQKWAF